MVSNKSKQNVPPFFMDTYSLPLEVNIFSIMPTTEVDFAL